MRYSPGLWTCLKVVAAVVAIVPAAAAPNRGASSTATVSAVIPRVKAGGLSLTQARAGTASDHAEVWKKVVRNLDHRHMPPLGMHGAAYKHLSAAAAYLA